ncbi:MAG TPA: NAD(+) diphosphatase [Pseudomonadales bacterium]|jgi:NAD+ diphosphatase|nr:NAD(+) diphosphatase [Gammaproteobacteria bacterium]MDP6025902.1 NAD(+) diphosphatase [Pseudomonadales bacterium]MDP7575739.1 NAD(+) diphosphatase [Pseudomonadales bacterium]HJL60651.1 NAD(+) diphosphatase [Pseudomonadales bacterium]HJP52550.1 NAD(+) diphosphatase [Pseudomonadales bacterium]|tara:strand:- start:1968 stop:2798 length:831 start_codon:yes stop_codon:yes gene_type:complete
MFVWPEAHLDFVPEVLEPEQINEAYYFVFDGGEILLNFDEAGQWVPLENLDQRFQTGLRQSHYMGSLGGVDCFTVETDLGEADKGSLRSLFGKTDNLMFSLAGRAVQLLDWFRVHQFCGRCGQQAERHTSDRAMVCSNCGIHSYPRLSPSIITLVHSDNKVLLARNHRFPNGMYSTLAGFVEPGESIEETLRREVKEEVGVNVGNLEYLGSQPWPFPNSLMLGFLAEYDSGDIVLQAEEIADAQWFDCKELPEIPGKVAISRWIIDTYLGRLGIHG